MLQTTRQDRDTLDTRLAERGQQLEAERAERRRQVEALEATLHQTEDRLAEQTELTRQTEATLADLRDQLAVTEAELMASGQSNASLRAEKAAHEFSDLPTACVGSPVGRSPVGINIEDPPVSRECGVERSSVDRDVGDGLVGKDYPRSHA